MAWLVSQSAVVAGELELATVKHTNYPIPPGSLFVDNSGSKTGDGSKASPFRSVSRAIDAANPGGTIVIHSGTYREALPDINKRLTIQPYPGAEVWLKGSLILKDWKPDGDAWRHDNWDLNLCRDCFHRDNIDPAHPNAGLPEQIFIDGKPLTQISRRSEIKTGAFFVDEDKNQLFIGTSPNGKIVEASAYPVALTLWQGSEGSVVRGLGFAHYAPSAEPGFGATVKANADKLNFENNTFAWSSVKGLSVFGKNARVQGNKFLHNGMMGLGAWKASGLLVTGNRFAFNNREHFVQTGTVSEVAGSKITDTRTLTVADNVFENNHSNGLWLDINVSDARIVRNKFRNNQRHGLFYEISSNATIASNIAAGNRVSGIALANASHIQVYNNTLVGNGLSFLVQNDTRINDNQQEIALGNTWIASDIQFYNNLLVHRITTNDPHVYVRDFSGVLDASDMVSSSDFNGYFQYQTPATAPLIDWWRGPRRNTFSSLKEYQSSTGRDASSLMLRSDPFSSRFKGGADDNFALRTGSAARNAGYPLPPDVAQAIGVGASLSTAPDLGALLLPGGLTVTP